MIAAQRRRRELEDLIEPTPADGLLAGTQGMQNHRKNDRLFEVIERLRLPVVFFAEGGDRHEASDAMFEPLVAMMVDRMYAHGKALNTATYFGFDDVIDPADSRRGITTALDAAPPPPPRQGKKRPMVDTW